MDKDACVAQLVKCLILGFSPGNDCAVREFRLGSTQKAQCLLRILSPLSLSLPNSLTLSK